LQVPCYSLGNLTCFPPIQKNRLDITYNNSQLCCYRYLPSLSHSLSRTKDDLPSESIYLHLPLPHQFLLPHCLNKHYMNAPAKFPTRSTH
jgi:hypothetical protein